MSWESPFSVKTRFTQLFWKFSMRPCNYGQGWILPSSTMVAVYFVWYSIEIYKRLFAVPIDAFENLTIETNQTRYNNAEFVFILTRDKLW